VPRPTQPFAVAADSPRDDLALGSIVQMAEPLNSDLALRARVSMLD